jgi:hypothetical protein
MYLCSRKNNEFKSMKQITRIILLAVCVEMLALTAKAQSSFSIGIKAGVNFSNYISESNLEAGADAGIFLRAGRIVYFQPEVLYSFRTSTINAMVDEVKENIELNDHFIDIPLFLGFKLVNKENFNLRLFLGPRVGLRVGSSYSDIDSLMGYAQWGGRIGLGIDFWRFTLDLSYDISANKFKQMDNSFWKQNMMSASLGFKFVK